MRPIIDGSPRPATADLPASRFAIDRQGAFPPPLRWQSRRIHPSARRVALDRSTGGFPAPLFAGKAGEFTPPRVASRGSIDRGLSRPLSAGKAGEFTPTRVASRGSIDRAAGHTLGADVRITVL